MNLPGRFADYIMPDKIHRLNVSFTVDSLRKEFGGTGGNCSYSLGLLGRKPLLLGAWGKDAGEYRIHLQEAEVDLTGVKIVADEMSACGYVMTDQDDNQIWSYFTGASKHSSALSLSNTVGKGCLVALLPTDPAIFVSQLKELVSLNADFLFDPAFFIPNLAVDDLVLGIKNARLIIGNDYEIALMERKTGTAASDWAADNTVVITTLGPEGSRILQGQRTWEIKAVAPKKVVDPTGAGDAYRAGFLAGYCQGFELDKCGQMGSTAAAYTVETYGTQTHTFSLITLNRRMKKAFN